MLYYLLTTHDNYYNFKQKAHLLVSS